jgi:hypothetical protein
MIFSDGLTQGIALGIIITCIAFYLVLQELSHHSFSKSLKWLSMRICKPAVNETKTPERTAIVLDTDPVSPSHRLNIKAHLDIRSILILLKFYKQIPTPELHQQIKQILNLHTADGSNYLHEYLTEYSFESEPPELDVVEEMLKIEPHLLFETDIEGNSPLHIAEQHCHTEIAEFLVQNRHFKNLAFRYNFLKHANRYGYTALHNAAYLWRYHPEHFLRMLEICPVDSLFWQDKYGRKVYEFFIDNNEINQKQIMEVLKYKYQHNIHLESPFSNNTQKKPSLTELFVKNYPDYIRSNKMTLNIPIPQARHKAPQTRNHENFVFESSRNK